MIERLVEGKELTEDETKRTLLEIIDDFNPVQMSAFLVLLRAKVC